MSDETTAAPGKSPTRPETPELERQSAAIADGAHRVGEFLDWLGEKGYHLGRYSEGGNAYDAGPRPADLIAAFYDIDLNKIEQERRALLEYVRELQS
jgi:hypothetical protein